MNISRLGSTPASALPAGTASATPPGVEEGEKAHGQRIAKFVGAIEKRVSNALEAGTLSSGQVQALKDAAAQFSQLMNRIDNADLANSPKRQVHFALQQLGEAVQGILHPGADAAVPSGPSIDTTA